MTELESTPDGGLAELEPELRRGSQTRKADTTLNCASETKALLKKYSQSKKVSMSIILDLVMPRVVEFDIFDPDWMDKLRTYTEKVNAEVNRFAFLDDPDLCPALQFVETHFLCIWSQPGRPPQSKKLAKEIDGAQHFCLGCTRTREIREGIADYETQIRTMKEKVKQGVILKVPSCIEGGAVSEDLKKLYCRRTTQYVKVSKCKPLKNGMANCDALRWATVTVKGVLPDAKK